MNEPEARTSKEIAASLGSTVEQFFVEAIAKEVREKLKPETRATTPDREMELP